MYMYTFKEYIDSVCAAYFTLSYKEPSKALGQDSEFGWSLKAEFKRKLTYLGISQR